LDDYADDFSNWSGTATASGSGDTEILTVLDSEEGISNKVQTGAKELVIEYDYYRTGSGTPGTIYYKTAATEGALDAQGWTLYTSHFTSLGWVQVRVLN